MANTIRAALPEDLKPSAIQRLYENSVILLTGATGHIGKCLVNKLFLACPGIKKIIIIGRGKKDKNIEERMEEQFKNPMVYGQLQDVMPNFREKLVIFSGDLSKERLGLTDEAIKLIITEVNIVFHVAATVRFDEKINVATAINLRGTKEILEIMNKCKSLKAAVHVSTAYSHCYREEIDEIFFKAVRDPNEFLKYVESKTEEELIAETPKILGEYPNTYTFTKGLAEELVRLNGSCLPLAIFRPSVVLGALNEPFPGYTANLNGPTGMYIAAGVGICHVGHASLDKTIDIVPVDMVVNSMIATALYASKRDRTQEIPIFNFVMGKKVKMNNGRLHDDLISFGMIYPSTKTIWYYSLICTENKLLYKILSFFLETIPAIVMDKILEMKGKQPMLWNIVDRLHKGHELTAYFSLREWKFIENNVTRMWNELEKKDKQLFPFDLTKLEVDVYASALSRFYRIHILKQPISNIEEGRKRYRKQKYLHYTLVTLFWCFCAYVLYIMMRCLF